MPPAQTPPELPAHGAPVSLLVDFDGTISLLDVGDQLLAHLAPDPAAVEAKDALYAAGVVGSRDLMRWDMDVLPRNADLLRREAISISLDRGLLDLVAVVRERAGAIEVVSDGLGFYVDDMLASLGLHDIPVATNSNRLSGGGAGMGFPYGHPRCFVCGTCKRERVLAHQAAGHVVILVGDGTSDRYAAAHADVVFAKASLARICHAAGWPYQPWEGLSDVAGWLREAFADGRLPADADAYERWRALKGDRGPGFICGPEVWGEGCTSPPLPSGLSEAARLGVARSGLESGPPAR